MLNQNNLKPSASYWIIAGLVILFSNAIFLLPIAGTYDTKRVLQYSLFIFNFIFLIFPRQRFVVLNILKQFNRPALWLVASLFTFSLIAVAVSAQPFVSLVQYLHYWLLLICLLVFICLFITDKSFNNFLVGLIISVCALYGFIVFVGFLAATLGGHGIHRPSLILNFYNFRYFNHLQTLTFIPLAYFITQADTKAQRAGLVILMLWWWCLVYSTMGRGTLISIFIPAITVLAFFIVSRPVSKILFSTSIAGLMTYLALFAGLPYLFDFHYVSEESLLQQILNLLQGVESDELTTSGRIALWKLAWQQFLGSPWFGIGPLMYACDPAADFGHPHNFILQLLAEFGSLATGCLLGLAAYGSYHWLQYLWKQPNAENSVLTATLLAWCLHSSVSGIYMTPFGQIGFWIIYRSPPSICIPGVSITMVCCYFNRLIDSLRLGVRVSTWQSFL